jgi:C4-dicarboxylate-specific signal transduction histidine kinase
VQDITRRREAEEEQHVLRRQLAHVSRVATVGELTAALAHEINQPLAAILANAQAARHIIAGEEPDLAELQAILDDIINDDKRAREVIRRVRSMLRKDGSKPEKVDINRIIQDAVKLVEHESDFKGISVVMDLADGLKPVMGDRIQVGQVVVNLLVNAVEAVGEVSDPSRSIIVGSRMEDERGVVVSVRDTGKGIGEESLQHLFEPFYTTKESGLGLGLSISRSIIEAHGGRLSALRNPDRGATFCFTLPAAEEADTI